MAELIINTGAVLNNYRHYAAGGQVIPVLKSNGYGLGAQQLRGLLHQEGATLFACSCWTSLPGAPIPTTNTSPALL